MLRLPQDIRTMITNFAERTDGDLMKLADSLRGTSRLATPAAASVAHEPEPADDDEEIAMAAQQRRPRRSHQRPVPDVSRKTLCYYHRRFGRDTKNCRSPCFYSKNM